MDVRPQLKDALDTLAPLFNTDRVSIDEFLKDDMTIANFEGPDDKCITLQYAGEMAGHYFYTKCNNGRVKDDSILALLQNTASKFAGSAYHYRRCNASHYSIMTRNTEEKLRQFIDRMLHPERLSPEEKMYLAIQPLELAEPLAHILFRKYSASKLGEFARMNTDEALKLLIASADEAVQ
jgi:hypothetical protein